MVECECIYKSRCRKAVYCFNRYMVECEFFSSASISSSAPVLIDTWWNVNDTICGPASINPAVLIDTWWNVNTNKLGAGVEEVSVLIDTWWNVNEHVSCFESECLQVLIDTWWNVNVDAAIISYLLAQF